MKNEAKPSAVSAPGWQEVLILSVGFDFWLQVNLFFLLNIIRVLVTKLRDTHRAESNMYMKAVRATLILVPLLGIQFVIFPWRPENRIAGEVYEYIMHILMHYQVRSSILFASNAPPNQRAYP